MGLVGRRGASREWLLLILIVVAALFTADARAQQRELRVSVSSARLVNFRAAARSVFIADPAIADIQVASPDSVIAFGRKPGQTTLIAMGANDKPLANMQVVVSHNYGDRAGALSQQTATPNAALAGVHTGRININNVIDALAEEGLVTILAQPNLTAISGQTASFLAGGEFPIPVAQNNTGGNNTITIEFKPFGVRLDFVPTVLSTDRIAIKVRPQVSELSTQGAIRIGELEIPAISVRRAETTIRLGSGESFAIAVLIQDNTNTDISKFPGLGDLPIIGPLFRSSRFQRQETELVIIVTPYVVRPVPEGPSLKLPTDRMEAASDFERIVLDRLVKPSAAIANPAGLDGARLRGDAGFIFE